MEYTLPSQTEADNRAAAAYAEAARASARDYVSVLQPTSRDRADYARSEAERLDQIASFAAALESYLSGEGREIEARLALAERAEFARRLAEHNAERQSYEEQELSEIGMTFRSGETN